ncbi:MAG: hypothetical protein AAGF75_00710 [Cyanobacteria bacterium P01_H01_bin.130]
MIPAELIHLVDYSGVLAHIAIVQQQMGLGDRSQTFKALLKRFHCQSLAEIESDRLDEFLTMLCDYRDRQPPEILDRIHTATGLAWRVLPRPNPWNDPELSQWRDRHCPLTVDALDQLISCLTRLNTTPSHGLAS